MKRAFKIILFIGILVTGFAALAVYWTFYRPLPDYNATLRLPELHQPVQIYWSPYGIPHIYASDMHDAYMAIGYVHAQDRRWQMNVIQMAAEGRFAEFFGEHLLPLDKFQRTVGFWRIAKKMETGLSDTTRRYLQAYANGVNHYTAQNKKTMPVQFAMAGMEPIPWTVTHSLALTRLMAWELNIAWKSELSYSLLFEELGPSTFRELFSNPKVTTNLPAPARNDTTGITSLVQPLLHYAQFYEQLMQTEGENAGSNAWAVSGSRSESGRPLLAGDPHLGLSIPGKWYELHLNAGDRNISGATLPGAPFVVLGQNNALAWSQTNLMLDDTDFFEEKIHPQDSSRYLLDSLAGEAVYEKLTIQREVIKVKNADDVTFSRKLTKHGPVISDIYPEQQLANDKTVSMQWTGLQASDEMEALRKMGEATSMTAFREAIRSFKVPGQNVLFADTAGNIARFSMAAVPLRSGNPVVLRPGWQPEYDWQGFAASDALPVTINPQRGWVANANNPVAGPDYPYYLSVYWQPQSRYNRIRQFLTDNNRFNSRSFQVMQVDTYSAYARTMANLILPPLKNSPDTTFATAVNYLENWDFNYGTSQTAASIMDVFLLRLAENTFADEMGTHVYKNFTDYNGKAYRVLLNSVENGGSFFDNTATETIESRDDIIRKSMEQTLSFLRDSFGDEPSEWRWGNLHTVTLKPPLFGRAAEAEDASSTLKLIVNNVLDKGPYPAPGHAMSINNGEYQWEKPYRMVLGPSIRRIIDLGDTGRSLSITPSGQSGNPFSEYYGDQTDTWLNGNYKFFYRDSSRFAGFNKMMLQPGK